MIVKRTSVPDIKPEESPGKRPEASVREVTVGVASAGGSKDSEEHVIDRQAIGHTFQPAKPLPSGADRC